MLTWLRVRDLAIMAELEIELQPGLNIITGETGAGKSLLVDALELLAGARAQADLVRTGAEECVIEALFDLTALDALREALAETLGTVTDELVIRRHIRAEGRSRAYVNGSLATASQLTGLARGLLDICSQHEHHTLVDPASHLACLDDYGGLRPLRASVAASWSRYAGISRELEEVARQAQERAEREAVLRLQLEDLRALAPQAGEIEELETEHGRLAHADRLASTARAAEDTLYARDNALSDQLARLGHQLDALRGLDADLDPLIDRADQLRTDLEDLGRDLGRYARGIVHDPNRLARIDERLTALRRLERRYGASLDQVIQRRARMEEEITALSGLEEKIEGLESERQVASEALVQQANLLSKARADRAASLGAAITSELRDLGMGQARVEVDVARLEARGGAMEIAGRRFSATGSDRVELLIAPNRGEPPRPLGKIASGGELSRSLLAIKRVLATQATTGLHVFDEVDSGVGGAVAEVIGQKLADVARNHQVLCITHLPQIAAYADQHIHISKATLADRTSTVARVLDRDARIEELARMMGGISTSDATRRAAADLIDSATAHKAKG
jgi:DNA repair protein RecN (Recombination protein N)